MTSWNSLSIVSKPQIKKITFNSTSTSKLETFDLTSPTYVFPDNSKNSKLYCNVTSIPTWLGWSVVCWLLEHNTTPMGSHIFQLWFSSRFERQDVCVICDCYWKIKDYSACLECWLRLLFLNDSNQLYNEKNFLCTSIAINKKNDELIYATNWEDVHVIYNSNSVHPAFVATLPPMSADYSSDLQNYTKIDVEKFKPYLLAGFCKSNFKKQQVKKFENPYTFALRVLFATKNTFENIKPFLTHKIVYDEMVLKNSCLNFSADLSTISGSLTNQILIPLIDVNNFKEIIREKNLYLNDIKTSIDYLVCGNCNSLILEEIKLKMFKNSTLFVRAWDTSIYDLFNFTYEQFSSVKIVVCVNQVFLKALEHNQTEFFLIPQCCNEAREILISPPNISTQLYNKAKQNYEKHPCSRKISLIYFKEVIQTFGIRLFNVQLANQKLLNRISNGTIQSITKASPNLDVIVPTQLNINYNVDEYYMFVYSQGISLLPFWDKERENFNFIKYTDKVSDCCNVLVEMHKVSTDYKYSNSTKLIKSSKENETKPVICVGPVDFVKVETKDENFLMKIQLCTFYGCLKETLKENGIYQYTPTYIDSLDDLASKFILEGDSKNPKISKLEAPAEANLFLKIKNFFNLIRGNARTNTIVSSGIPLIEDCTISSKTTFGLESVFGYFNMNKFVNETGGSMEELYIKKYMNSNMSNINSIHNQYIDYNKIDNFGNPISLPSFSTNVSIVKPINKFQNLQIWPLLKSNIYDLLIHI